MTQGRTKLITQSMRKNTGPRQRTDRSKYNRCGHGIRRGGLGGRERTGSPLMKEGRGWRGRSTAAGIGGTEGGVVGVESRRQPVVTRSDRRCSASATPWCAVCRPFSSSRCPGSCFQQQRRRRGGWDGRAVWGSETAAAGGGRWWGGEGWTGGGEQPCSPFSPSLSRCLSLSARRIRKGARGSGLR